jgi:hypothetical protein
MTNSWDEVTVEEQARRIVQGVVRLSGSDDAVRLLGVEGTLEDEVELSFLVEPVDWIASEIASTIRQGADGDDDEAEDEADDDTGGASLSAVVALARLYRILRGEPIEERELLDSVLEYLQDYGD